MPNYYEILNIQPASTRAEVEDALDSQYNKFRQLVTHHDTHIVNQATVGLQTLEKIRSVLMDDGKRSAYDAAISGNMGGLADPTANSLLMGSTPISPMQSGSPASASPRYLPPTQAPAQRIWTCPKCQTSNAVNSQFCKKCGQSLAGPCPECNLLVETGSKFCTNCGVNVEKALQKKDWQRELSRSQTDLNVLARGAPVLDPKLPELRKSVVISGAWTVAAVVAGLTYLLSGLPGMLPGVNLTGLIMAFNGDTSYLSVGMTDITFVGAALAILAVVVVFLSIIQKISPTKGIGVGIAIVLLTSVPKTTQSLLIMTGEDALISMSTAWVVTAFIYFLIFVRMFAVLKQNFDQLQPYYKKIPKTGCLGGVFSLMLFAIPVLYVLYVALLSSHGERAVSDIMNNYEFYAWYVNAIQLFIMGLLLLVYMIMNWRTAQSADVQYRQAVVEHSVKVEKLTKQVQVLTQALAGLDLRS